MASTKKPAIPLYAYQRRWLEDTSRFKLWVKSVQIGASWVMALELAMALAFGRCTWLWMSASQRQSREAAEYTKTHLTAMGAAVQLDLDAEEFFGETRTLVDRIVLPNGSRAFFLPANPDTARGFAGNVVLDEFGIHKNPKAIWASMFGRVSRGYKLRVLSSPKGAVGKFWELARQIGLDTGVRPDEQPVVKRGWSGHWTDVHMAIADGAPLDAAALRDAMADDELFAQEYLCQFLDAESQLIPTELIEAAVSGRAALELPSGFRAAGPLYMGTDVGRLRDLTVHAGIERLPEAFVVRFVDIQRKATFAAQKARIKEFLPLVARHAMDATGIGMQNAEELHREFPAKCEAVDFAKGDVKSSIALGLRRLFEDRKIEIPDDRDLKADLKAVKRIITESGNIRYDARRGDQGHADRFWALGLAHHASDRPAQSMADYGFATGEGVITTRQIAALEGVDRGGDDWFKPQPMRPRPRMGVAL